MAIQPSRLLPLGAMFPVLKLPPETNVISSTLVAYATPVALFSAQPHLSQKRICGKARNASLRRCSTSKTSTFVMPRFCQLQKDRHAVRSRVLSIKCSSADDTEDSNEKPEEERQFLYKFDPNSEKDAFGRDPRKETEYWMGAAKSVLESEEVQEAIANHAADGGDGLTDEQRAYMEFIKRLDSDSTSEK